MGLEDRKDQKLPEIESMEAKQSLDELPSQDIKQANRKRTKKENKWNEVTKHKFNVTLSIY